MQGVKIINIGGTEVGLYRLDEIFKEARALGIDGEVLKEEPLKRVKVDNWIPESKEREFATAIFKAYESFCKKADSGG